MTNVSKGDLALCIGDQNPLKGKTCTVLDEHLMQHTEIGQVLVWLVEFPSPVPWEFRIIKLTDGQSTGITEPHMNTTGWMPDVWMRKLSGPGMEAEVLRHWLAPPGERLAIAKPRRYIGVTPLSNTVFPDIREVDIDAIYRHIIPGPL